MRNKQEEPASDTKRLKALLAVLCLLLLGGAVMAMVGSGGGGSGVSRDEVDRLRDETKEKWKDKKDLTEEERKAMREDWGKVKEKSRQLPFEERKKDMQKFMAKDVERSNPYYAIQSEEERKAWLDNYIQDQAAKQANRGGGQGRGGPNGGGPGGPNGGGPNGGGPGGPNGGQEPTAQQNQQRDNGQRQWLQMSSPEQRAQTGDFRYQVKQQAQALGLPVPRMGPPGGFGGGGGPRGGGGGGAAPPPGPMP